jgi:hypothetical protein
LICPEAPFRPIVREHVVQVGPGRSDGELGQDVFQVGPRVDVKAAGAGAHAQQDGRGFQATVAPDLKPVKPTDGDRTNGLFGRTVVVGESCVGMVPNPSGAKLSTSSAG